MRAGPLRHRVTIQTLTTTVDAYGGPVSGWTDRAEVWAEISGVSGREFFAARQEQSEVTVRARIRYRSDVTPEMRVRDGARLLNIVAVLHDNRRTVTTLLCREASSEQ